MKNRLSQRPPRIPSMLRIAIVCVLAASATAFTQGNTHPLGTFSANDPEGNTIALTFDSAGGLWVYVNGEAYASSTYKATGDEFEIKEVSAPSESSCGTAVGRYKWKLEENRLIYTFVSDTCELRSSYLVNLRWVKSTGAPASPSRDISRAGGRSNRDS